MEEKLILTAKNKKRKRQKKPILIAALIVICGLSTLIFELQQQEPCGNECLVSVNLMAPINNSKTAIDGKTAAKIIIDKTLSDIELENSRLLLQRELQRILSESDIKKPFNFKKDDYCTLSINKNKKISIVSCSNHVFKRTIELSLKSNDVRQAVSKYHFGNVVPFFNIRLS